MIGEQRQSMGAEKDLDSFVTSGAVAWNGLEFFNACSLSRPSSQDSFIRGILKESYSLLYLDGIL